MRTRFLLFAFALHSNMGAVKSYEDLIVWQKSVCLVEEIYTLTSSFPKSELFGLTSQMNRSAVSVPSNIAEGFGRRSSEEFKRYLKISLGSLYELKTQVLISNRLGFITYQQMKSLEDLFLSIDKIIHTILKKW